MARMCFRGAGLALALAVGMVSAGGPRTAQAAVKVVATVPGLAALVKEVGGIHVTVKSFTQPTQDPHFVDARPNLALELNRADLLVLVGLQLEVGWLRTLLVGARNARVQPGAAGYLDTSQFVSLMQVSSGPIDRSQGDIHPGGNPHYLADPRAGAAVAKGIAARLAAIDPVNRGTYEVNLAAFLTRLAAARQGWEERLAPLRGAPVIAYHQTWAYVANWLGLETIGFLEPKPGIPPNPQHVARLLEFARERRVRAVLQEEYYPDKTARLVAEKIPAPLLRVPGGPHIDRGESYVDYLARMVLALEPVAKQPAKAP